MIATSVHYYILSSLPLVLLWCYTSYIYLTLPSFQFFALYTFEFILTPTRSWASLTAPPPQGRTSPHHWHSWLWIVVSHTSMWIYSEGVMGVWGYVYEER